MEVLRGVSAFLQLLEDTPWKILKRDDTGREIELLLINSVTLEG